jgi:hypothetical protein
MALLVMAGILVLGLRPPAARADEETWCTYPQAQFSGYGYTPMDGDGGYVVCRFICTIAQVWHCAPGHTPPDCESSWMPTEYPIDWPGPPQGEMCVQDYQENRGKSDPCVNELPLTCDHWKY